MNLESWRYAKDYRRHPHSELGSPMNHPVEIESLAQGENEDTANSSESVSPSFESGTALPQGSEEPEEPEGLKEFQEPKAPKPPRSSLLLLAIVTVVSLGMDLGTKWWALHTLEKPLPNGMAIPSPIQITPWLSMVLARNRGGAWGLLQGTDEAIRTPFFLIISALAIVFIVYLYRRVHPKQHALKWGLPLVLGGAVGNLVDRIRYGWVIDFIDYKATWVRVMNEQLVRVFPSHAVTDHWPTFNIADVAICVGVGLMAIDMFTSRSVHHHKAKLEGSSDGVKSQDTFEPTAPPSDPATPSEPGNA
jgi:signal peptidase II